MNPRTVDVARRIDHTLLEPEATPARIDTLCEEAVRFGFGAVCVNPVHVRHAVARLEALWAGATDRQRPIVVSVAGFPLGASASETKSEEARRAIGDGAREVDMVVQLGALVAGDRVGVRRDIEIVASVVHQADPPGILKVILETAALTDAQIVLGCRLCAEGEADFVKTSTGFHAAGGATVEHVRLLHRLAPPLGVKASGGIRTAKAALAMLEAGADRLGTSSGVAILEGLREQPV